MQRTTQDTEIQRQNAQVEADLLEFLQEMHPRQLDHPGPHGHSRQALAGQEQGG